MLGIMPGTELLKGLLGESSNDEPDHRLNESSAKANPTGQGLPALPRQNRGK